MCAFSNVCISICSGVDYMHYGVLLSCSISGTLHKYCHCTVFTAFSALSILSNRLIVNSDCVLTANSSSNVCLVLSYSPSNFSSSYYFASIFTLHYSFVCLIHSARGLFFKGDHFFITKLCNCAFHGQWFRSRCERFTKYACG